MSRARLVALIMGLCVIGDSMLYTALPACFMDIGLDAQTTGAILSVNRFARLLFNPAAAVVLLRLGQKRTAVVAACLAVFTTMGYSFVTTPAAWLTLRVLWGLSWSLIRLTAFVVTLSEVRETRRGEALGGMQRLVRLGSLAGAFGGGFLLDLVGFRSTARILGTLTCVAVLLSLVRTKTPRRADFWLQASTLFKTSATSSETGLACVLVCIALGGGDRRCIHIHRGCIA